MLYLFNYLRLGHSLEERVVAVGFRVRLVTLDAGFYTIDVLNFVSQFKYVIAVPVGDVKVYQEFDGEYETNSKRHRKDEQVEFRLLVYSKEAKRKRRTLVYFARATNLNLPKGEVWAIQGSIAISICFYRMKVT